MVSKSIWFQENQQQQKKDLLLVQNFQDELVSIDLYCIEQKY